MQPKLIARCVLVLSLILLPCAHAAAQSGDGGLWPDDKDFDAIVKAGKKVKDVISNKEGEVDGKVKKGIKKVKKGGTQKKDLAFAAQGGSAGDETSGIIYGVGAVEYAWAGAGDANDPGFAYNTLSLLGGAGYATRAGSVFPFVEGLVGISRLGFTGDSETKPAVQFGAGVTIPVQPKIAVIVEFDVRHLLSADDVDANQIGISAGIVYKFKTK